MQETITKWSVRSWDSKELPLPRDVPGRKDRKVKSRRESILLKNKYEKLLKILWKNIEIKDCPVLWPPSRPEDFDPSAHKVWDSRKPPGCSGSLYNNIKIDRSLFLFCNSRRLYPWSNWALKVLGRLSYSGNSCEPICIKQNCSIFSFQSS